MELAEVLKALADSNRLRILALLDGRTLCVCDIERILGLNQSNLSRHLATLRHAGLVLAHKRGLYMHYTRLPQTGPQQVLFASLYDYLRTSQEFAADLEALQGSSSLAQPC